MRFRSRCLKEGLDLAHDSLLCEVDLLASVPEPTPSPPPLQQSVEVGAARVGRKVAEKTPAIACRSPEARPAHVAGEVRDLI